MGEDGRPEVDPSPPPEADGSSNSAPKNPVDDFLAGLLKGEVRVKVDPSSGKIVEVRVENPARQEAALDTRAEDA